MPHCILPRTRACIHATTRDRTPRDLPWLRIYFVTAVTTTTHLFTTPQRAHRPLLFPPRMRTSSRNVYWRTTCCLLFLGFCPCACAPAVFRCFACSRLPRTAAARRINVLRAYARHDTADLSISFSAVLRYSISNYHLPAPLSFAGAPRCCDIRPHGTYW